MTQPGCTPGTNLAGFSDEDQAGGIQSVQLLRKKSSQSLGPEINLGNLL